MSTTKIRKAVFPVAGFGTRFLPATKAMPKELMPIVGFNMLRDIPIIFSLSLFLAIIISISQMYKSSEAVIMNSVGIGDKGFIYYIQPIVILSFIVVFILTIYAVPWAKQQKSFAEDQKTHRHSYPYR